MLSELFLYTNPPLDLKSVDGNLIVTTKSNVYIYDGSFNLISQVELSLDYVTTFTAASINSDYIYIGTKDFGIL